MQCLRIILGISMWDIKRNTTIRKLARMPRMSTILSQRRLRLLGHLACIDDHCLPKKLLVSAPAGGSRAVGGQTLRWNDLISRDLRESGTLMKTSLFTFFFNLFIVFFSAHSCTCYSTLSFCFLNKPFFIFICILHLM